MDLEVIHPSVIDPTTKLYPNHNVFTHLGCVLVRVGLGLSIMNINDRDKDEEKKVFSSHNIIILILIALIVLFLVKRIKMGKESVYWKSYIRMLLAYTIALFMVIRKDYSNAGLFVIIDALMGLQSRHSASVASHICESKKNESGWSLDKEVV